MRTNYIFSENRNIAMFMQDKEVLMSESPSSDQNLLVVGMAVNTRPTKFKMDGESTVSSNPTVETPAEFLCVSNPEVTVVSKNILEPVSYRLDNTSHELSADDFQNGIWDENATHRVGPSESVTTITNSELIHVYPGDALSIKSSNLYVSIGLYVPPSSVEPTTQVGFQTYPTTTKYTFNAEGLAFVTLRKENKLSHISPSDYDAEISVCRKNCTAGADLVGDKVVLEKDTANRMEYKDEGRYRIFVRDSNTLVLINDPDPSSVWLLVPFYSVTENYIVSGKIEQSGYVGTNPVIVTGYFLDSDNTVQKQETFSSGNSTSFEYAFTSDSYPYLAININSNSTATAHILSYMVEGLQVEPGSVKTAYAEYQQTKYTYSGNLYRIQKDADELAENPEETDVHDEWDLLTQTVIRRIAKKTYSGDSEENWIRFNVKGDAYPVGNLGNVYKIANDDMRKDSKSSGLCNRFLPNKSPVTRMSGRSPEGYITFGCPPVEIESPSPTVDREALFGTFIDGTATAKATIFGTTLVWRTSYSPRATTMMPFKNNNYIFTVTDPTKYQLYVRDITGLNHITCNESNSLDHYGYPCGNKQGEFAESDSVTTPYCWVTLKKLDGTDFTAAELENGAEAVFTYVTNKDQNNFDGSVMVRYDNSDITTAAEWKQWLTTHNTDILYRLAQETTEKVDAKPLVLPEGTFFILCSEGCSLDITYLRRPFS